MKTRIAMLIIGIAVGAYLGGVLSSHTVYVYVYNHTQSPCKPINYTNVSYVSMTIPAVDQEGNGIPTTLEVLVVPGSGKALVNIDKLLFWTDTQNSIRMARNIAEKVTGIDLENYDLIYTIKANASVIEGPSAGAAITIATIAALTGKELNKSVMITGTINHDGSIGPVGEILAKAVAAKSVGAELFLVPLAQSNQITYRSERYCEQIGWTQICTIEQIPVKVNIAEEAGIEVKEVGSIEEAMEYFFSD